MTSVKVPAADEHFVGDSAQPALPSEAVEPTQVDSVPQQASTSPGDGSEVQASDPKNVVYVQGEPQRKPSFKEQVIGYAKVTRGTLLRKPGVKEQGEKILEGQATVQEPAAM